MICCYLFFVCARGSGVGGVATCTVSNLFASAAQHHKLRDVRGNGEF